MRECPNCKLNNNDHANYCTACGAPLGSSPSSGGVILHHMVSTTFDVFGQRVVRNLGLVRGIVVRSRSIVGTVGASLQTLVGGDISLFTELCEKTRNEAFERMLQHAADLGANAVIGFRYDATELMNGVTEVLAYGTAVIVQPVS